MSSDAEQIIRELRDLGCTLDVRPDGRLIVKGDVPSDLQERIRQNKPMITAQVHKGGSAGRVPDETWEEMRRIAPFIGREVETGEPWGRGILWGVSPRGAAVHVGPVLVTFRLEDVRPSESQDS